MRTRLGATGRDVELVAVTKGFPAAAVTAAVAAGCERIGENYAQELLAKSDAVDGAVPRRPAVHFIGRLQSNKVRQLASVVDVWESIDRPALVREVAKRAAGATVLSQVNATGEPDKGGCPLADVAGLVDAAATAGLDVDGLMTVGPTDGDLTATADAFRSVRRATDDLGLATCSMGMSGDLDIALDCGTTRVRVGTALFGFRNPQDSIG